MQRSDGIGNVLLQLLEQQHACATILLDTLRREQIALTRNDIVSLETVVSTKHRHLNQLEMLSRQTEDALKSTGPRDRSDTVVEDVWRKLRQLLGECQLQNQINGGLIEQGRRRVQQALNLLTGRDIESTVYRPDGARDATSLERLYARA